MLKSLHFLTLSLVLAGCGTSLITPRAFDPVIEDTVGTFGQSDIGIISTTADRRSIAFRNVPDGVEPGDRITVEFCPEPPPDALTDVFQEFTARLAGNVGNTEISEAQLSNILSLTNQILFQRSQGVQLFRDGMYGICILHMNRMLDTDKVEPIVRLLVDESATLVKEEIERGKVIGSAQASASTEIPATLRAESLAADLIAADVEPSAIEGILESQFPTVSCEIENESASCARKEDGA